MQLTRAGRVLLALIILGAVAYSGWVRYGDQLRPRIDQLLGRTPAPAKSATPEAVKLPAVYFGEGSSTLDLNAKTVLRMVADRLRASPGLCVKVRGSAGSGEGAGKSLSEQRAQAVVDYLVSIDPAAFPVHRFVARGLVGEPVMAPDAHRMAADDPDATRRAEIEAADCNGKP